jgi:peptide/nickel transport system ATP-binding protein
MVKPLMKVEKLSVTYPGKKKDDGFMAVREVSFDVRPGEVIGIVGESGSGKSSVGRAIVGLAPISSGAITFEEQPLKNVTIAERREMAKKIQVVFQDPYSSLNPTMSIKDILSEPLVAGGLSKSEAEAKVASLLDAVELPKTSLRKLPREFSGGQRQRIAIARALTVSPKLIICDEPASALDLTTQAIVLELLLSIQRETGVAYLFISHDLSVVRHMSHRIAVMRAGEIVEFGDCDQVSSSPIHEYSQKLQRATLVADPDVQALRRQARLKADESVLNV